MEQSYHEQVGLLNDAKLDTWEKLDGLKGKNYTNTVRQIVKECTAPNQTTSTNWKINWALGKPGAKVKLCKNAFCRIVGRGSSVVSQLISEVKKNIVESAPRMDDKGNPYRTKEAKEILEAAQETFGITLNHHQLGSGLIPNSDEAKSVAAWMESVFMQMGDHVPNGAGEIHLSNMTKHSLYTDYTNDMSRNKRPGVVSETEFNKIWDCCYEHVKTRKFLNVCGKCSTCGDLNEERCKTLNPQKREFYTQLAALHRTMFMAERRLYYSRRNEAITSPSFILSTIADGMAQTHCEIPYRARAAQFTPNVTQHLLGIINHGAKNFTMYRSFGNIEGKFNLSAYCWLMELEKEYDANESRLQDVIYHQTDGGSENANWETLALAELLIIKGLTKKVVITRLPVGHTHEVNQFSKFRVGSFLLWSSTVSNFRVGSFLLWSTTVSV